MADAGSGIQEQDGSAEVEGTTGAESTTAEPTTAYSTTGESTTSGSSTTGSTKTPPASAIKGG